MTRWKELSREGWSRVKQEGAVASLTELRNGVIYSRMTVRKQNAVRYSRFLRERTDVSTRVLTGSYDSIGHDSDAEQTKSEPRSVKRPRREKSSRSEPPAPASMEAAGGRPAAERGPTGPLGALDAAGPRPMSTVGSQPNWRPRRSAADGEPSLKGLCHLNIRFKLR